MLLQASDLSLPRRLNGVSISAAHGELVCLVGPNGSGKTSLLHALAGIGSPSGKMNLGGVDPRGLGPGTRAKYLTFLPASRDVPWPLLARDLIALGGDGSPSPALELDGLMKRRVDSLSTGERSRVLIARALLPRPMLLLLDEPTANLDPLWQFKVMELVKTQVHSNGTGAILAIHDLDLAARFADRIMVMNEGRIAAEGLDGPHVADVFGIARVGTRWEPLSRPADPQSSP